MSSCSIRQLEERHIAVDVDFLLWNDKMDLLAIANVKGEVSLHRLIWPKVWTLAAPQIESSAVNKVCGMAWRPDGKVLAVAYESGSVLIVDVENKLVLHSFLVAAGVTSVKWIQEKVRNNKPKSNFRSAASASLREDSGDSSASSSNAANRSDKSSKFLSKPSASSAAFSGGSSKAPQDGADRDDLASNETEINLLIVGTRNGEVLISVFGIFTCAQILAETYLKNPASVLCTEMSEDLTLLYVTTRDDSNGHVRLNVIETDVFKTHADELFAIASKHAHLKSLITYLTNTLNATTEAWESILLEMDSKLSTYAETVPDGTVAADFLELLMFGTPSTEMEQFLLHDLTEKGLKKMGHSIELSYANIQKLLLKHLTKVGQNVTYHLAELRGMARMASRYAALGLDETKITDAILANGAFLVKSVEMQQVINHSMINYKAFFRWLYVVILRLTDEQVPPEIPKMTQQDLAYITEFLQNFDNIGRKQTKRNGFTMERLGQYLVDSPLTLPPNVDTNIWEVFLDENACIREDRSIVKHFREMSLVQQHKHLERSIGDIFQTPKFSIAKRFKHVKTINCATQTLAAKFTQVNMADAKSAAGAGFMFAFVGADATGIYCRELNAVGGGNFGLKVAHFFFKDPASGRVFRVVDVKFYGCDQLSVLLEEDASRNAFLCQVPVASLRELMKEAECTDEGEGVKVDASDCVSAMKAIEGMVVSHFAVSGSRKVSVVLAENLKKIRLFEMEGEEDEEEDDAMNTRESDSLQDSSIALE